jgi:hypothetical protein
MDKKEIYALGGWEGSSSAIDAGMDELPIVCLTISIAGGTTKAMVSVAW